MQTHPSYLPRRKGRGSVAVAALSILTLLGSPAAVRAVTSIGDNAELFVTGDAKVTSTDNLFLVNSQVLNSGGGVSYSDTYLDLTPGLDLEYGQNSDWKGSLLAQDDFQEFDHNSNLDTNLPSLLGKALYEDGESKLDFDASWVRGDLPTLPNAENSVGVIGIQGVPYLVKRDAYSVDGSGEAAFTEKTSGSVGLDFTDINYDVAHYDNSQSYIVPLNAYYKIDPKYDLSLGVTYRQDDIGGGVGTDHNYFYNVGVRGEIAPNLTGTFAVGYNVYQPVTGGSTGFVGLASNLSYQYLENVKFQFNLASDSGYNPFGADYKTDKAGFSVDVALDPRWSVGGTFEFQRLSYLVSAAHEPKGERDDYYVGGVHIAYALGSSMSVTLADNYSNDQSSYDGFNGFGFPVDNSFAANSVTLSFTAKF